MNQEIALFAFVGLGVAIWLLVAFFGALPMVMLWKADLEPLDESGLLDALNKVHASGMLSGDWYTLNGFEPEGAWSINAVTAQATIVGWGLEGERTYLCVYLVNDSVNSLDIVTSLRDGCSLTTGNTRDGQLCPAAPGEYNQTFDCDDIQALWVLHQQALEFLHQTKGLPPDPTESDLLTDLSTWLKQQESHIRKIPLWWLRIPHWYVQRRNLRHNRPISDLHRS